MTQSSGEKRDRFQVWNSFGVGDLLIAPLAGQAALGMLYGPGPRPAQAELATLDRFVRNNPGV